MSPTLLLDCVLCRAHNVFVPDPAEFLPALIPAAACAVMTNVVRPAAVPSASKAASQRGTHCEQTCVRFKLTVDTLPWRSSCDSQTSRMQPTRDRRSRGDAGM
jgi:hypothetical protein